MPKPVLTSEQFLALATLMRGQPDSIAYQAAYAMLVEGTSNGDLAQMHGVTRQRISQAVKNYRDALELAQTAAGIKTGERLCFTIGVRFDVATGLWGGQCPEIGMSTDGRDLRELMEKCRELVPLILPDYGYSTSVEVCLTFSVEDAPFSCAPSPV